MTNDQHATICRGINSLLWMLDNAHNHDAPMWSEMMTAAREDADRAKQTATDMRMLTIMHEFDARFAPLTNEGPEG